MLVRKPERKVAWQTYA